MSFPDTFMQAWFNFEFPYDPVSPQPGHSWKASCFWWKLVSGSVETDPAEQQVLCQNVSDTLTFCYDAVGVPILNSFVQVYVQSPGNNFEKVCLNPIGANDFSLFLPYSWNVTVNRIIDDSGMQIGGRFYLPGIKKTAVDQNHLTNAAHTGYQADVEYFQFDMFGSTSLWRAHAVSWKNGTFLPIKSLRVSQNIALLRKRVRRKPYTNAQWTTFKPPPA